MNSLQTESTYFTQLKFKSRYSNFNKSLTFFIVPQITDLVPSEAIDKNACAIPSHVRLADPNFHVPARVDMLIGAGPTLSMFCTGQIILSRPEDLILQKTKLGWIVGGGVSSIKSNRLAGCFLTNPTFDLERFWNIEEVPKGLLPESTWSKDKINCEDHFKSHVKRDENGRYVVAQNRRSKQFKEHSFKKNDDFEE